MKSTEDGCGQRFAVTADGQEEETTHTTVTKLSLVIDSLTATITHAMTRFDRVDTLIISRVVGLQVPGAREQILSPR